jgi:hypothetical protein
MGVVPVLPSHEDTGGAGMKGAIQGRRRRLALWVRWLWNGGGKRRHRERAAKASLELRLGERTLARMAQRKEPV